MTAANIILDTGGDPALVEHVETWLSGRSPRTREEYERDALRFAAWLGHGSVPDAMRHLFAGRAGDANKIILRWKGEMLDGGLSSATINRRLAVVRSCVSMARQVGIIEWDIAVPGVKGEARRLETPVTWDAFSRALLTEPAARNRALLALLGQRGLRCSEAINLALSDVQGQRLTIHGKGRREAEILELSPDTARHVEFWIMERGRHDGPLFGITANCAQRVVKIAGARVGIPDMHPHALRHTFGTRVAEMNDGDEFIVKGLMRHSDIRTSARYVHLAANKINKALLKAVG